MTPTRNPALCIAVWITNQSDDTLYCRNQQKRHNLCALCISRIKRSNPTHAGTDNGRTLYRINGPLSSLLAEPKGK